jgi:hypothetical protein
MNTATENLIESIERQEDANRLIFDKAKKDKNARSLIFIQRPGEHNGKPFLRICIDTVSKYTGKPEMEFVEITEGIELKLERYQVKPVSIICFHMPTFYEHIQSFLKDIKPCKKISFKVVAYNSCDADAETQTVRHQLYATIDNRSYFLSCYVGADNTASLKIGIGNSK